MKMCNAIAFRSFASRATARKRKRGVMRYFVELTCALCLLPTITACDSPRSGSSAQEEKMVYYHNKGGVPPSRPETTSGVPFGDGKKYSEPGLRGKIVDGVTQKPLEGAMVYGYYATQKGSLGGGKQLVELVRSFETATDANGVFTLPAWDTGDRPVKGEALTLFPMLMFYMPGYDTWHNNFRSIKQWDPKSGVDGTDYELKDGVYDWTKYPHRMMPANNERDRYFALNDAAIGMQFIGECGWEAYAKTLFVMHNEKKNMIREFVPADGIDESGYAKGNYSSKDPHVSYVGETLVDRLLVKFATSPSTWRCASPVTVFRLSDEYVRIVTAKSAAPRFSQAPNSAPQPNPAPSKNGKQ
jgi:hypothetical protein